MSIYLFIYWSFLDYLNILVLFTFHLLLLYFRFLNLFFQDDMIQTSCQEKNEILKQLKKSNSTP